MKSTAIFFTLLFYYSSVSAGCEMKVRTFNAPPQMFTDAQGNWQGIAIDLAQEMLDELDCQPIYVEVPWRRALHLLEHGELDLLLNVTKTAKRASYVYFVGPMRDENIRLILPKSQLSRKLVALDDLTGLGMRIGIVRGVTYGNQFDRKMLDPKFAKHFEIANSGDTNLESLENGRLFAIIADADSLRYALDRRLSKNEFAIHPFVINTGEVYFGFSKEKFSSTQLKVLNEAYARRSQQGAFAQVLKRYREVD